MSVSIEKITIDEEEGRFVLAKAQAAAVLDIGTSWQRLRIGARIKCDDGGANITGTPRLLMGVLSNPSADLANGPLSGAATSHYLGIRTATATWTRVAGPPTRYTLSTNLFGLKKVGAAETTFTPTSASTGVPSDASIRVPWFIEILKGTPWKVDLCVPGTAALATDITLDQLRTAMEIDTLTNVRLYMATIASGTYGNSTGTSASEITVDEGADGSLNALCVGWDRETVPVRFSEVLFAHFES